MRARWMLSLLALLLCAGGAAAEDEKGAGPGSAAPPVQPIWRDYARVASLAGHETFVRCAAFSPDGGILATGGSDRSLRLWNGRTGATVAVHQLPRSG